jgi:hypothetical protein
VVSAQSTTRYNCIVFFFFFFCRQQKTLHTGCIKKPTQVEAALKFAVGEKSYTT